MEQCSAMRLSGCACLAGLVILLSCVNSAVPGGFFSTSLPGQPSPVEQAQHAATEDVFSPIAYFETHCARCHGSYGKAYGEDFGRNLDERALFRFVKEMTEGPADEPLEGAELESLVAYHRSLIDGRPFVFISRRGGDEVKGEVSPGATMQIIDGDGKRHEAKVEGHQFTAKASFSGELELIARSGNQETRLKSSQKHSHRMP